MTIRDDDVRRSAQELRSLLLGLDDTPEAAGAGTTRTSVASEVALLAARLDQVETELEATKSQLAASVLREAALLGLGKGSRWNRKRNDVTDRYIRTVTTTSSPSQEILQAKELLDAGTISYNEFAAIKAKAMGTQDPRAR
ncbi:hypothetical protein [Cryobacterium sp. MLB-32]|uniref:hypothetical protein n=1 Tax=Cryobacterium sp. MLB-32 TaxID=1529318 RepID=UPI00055E2C50|nr:hypothetical protein [Cryobacterium sp. MLB-32]